MTASELRELETNLRRYIAEVRVYACRSIRTDARSVQMCNDMHNDMHSDTHNNTCNDM